MSQPRKIFFVITQGEWGGAQRYVFDLATNLPKQDWKVSVLIGEGGGELKTRLEKANVNALVIKNLVRSIHPLRDLLAIGEISKILKTLEPDIVHLNSSKAGVLGSLAARRANIKSVVFTAHGFAFLEPKNWLIRQIYYWAEKIATRFRKKIIAVSNFDRQAAIKSKLCAQEKIITIHNGIKTS